MDLLTQLNRTTGISILLVTHDPRILDIADRIVAMEDGRIVQPDAADQRAA
jgi:putative ABC transport system ATP-binding protein